ncbi:MULTISPECIES: DUF3465 domain-containing protein [Psychromonas]|uniref:DUF3465 domain-containing protein n=1 Tax=Psychromonas TaxID=67572 RepID=UPI0003F68FED|nr:MULTISPECIES: DUF3465 domain-containing protein [Psychromonas]
MKNSMLMLLALLLAACDNQSQPNGVTSEPLAKYEQIKEAAYTISISANSEQRLSDAFKDKRSDLQIAGKGTVVKLLTDDLKGSQHQRFIIKTNTGQTLLVAHNIDLAPRINTLKVGDSIEFYGEYEWNKHGGVMHWTHKDPKQRHIDGWLRHAGLVYQ